MASREKRIGILRLSQATASSSRRRTTIICGMTAPPKRSQMGATPVCSAPGADNAAILQTPRPVIAD